MKVLHEPVFTEQAQILQAWSESVLAGLPNEIRDRMVRGARLVKVPRKQPLYVAFTPSRLLLIRSGQARIKAASPNGRSATVRYIGPGELVGLPSLVAGTSPVGAEAVIDSQVVVFDAELVKRIARRSVEVAWLFAQELAHNSLTGTQNLGNNLFDSVLQRVARELLDLSTPAPEGLVVSLDQQSIASAVGSVREVVARTLRSLREDGIIGKAPGGILILDVHRLREVAAGHSAA